MKVLPVVSVLACLSCSPVVESGPGVILCEEVESCDDGNDCTIDVCVLDTCEHYGHPSPHECKAGSDAVGLCVWDQCVVQACTSASDMSPCFIEGGLGKCSGEVCVPTCDTWADCPMPPECLMPVCKEGLCGTEPAPDGSLCTGMNPTGMAVCVGGKCPSCG